MSEKFGSMGLASVQNRYLDGSSVMNCSPDTQTLIDDEVRRLLDDCQKKAGEILEKEKASLDRIAEHLLEKENITGEEFMRLLGENIER